MSKKEFIAVCKIASERLSDMAEEIAENRDTISLEVIKKYWEYSNDFDEMCVKRLDIALRELELEKGELYIK